jgi:monoamine oxidase
VPFSGQLLAPDFSVAHRLRDSWRPPSPSQPPSRHRVLIVGGGIAGLSAAWQLQRSGIDDFRILELDAKPGGTSASGTRRGFQFPWGAHYIPVPMPENTRLIELLESMDVVTGRQPDGSPIVAEQFLCREPTERVFADGRWTYGLYPGLGASREDRRQLKRFREWMGRWADRRDDGGRRMFAIPTGQGSDAAEVRQLDGISMAQWLRDHRLTSERLRWLVDYSCRDDYGLSVEQTSAWAGIFYFASRLRTGQSSSQPVITWPEGNGRIVDFLADCCGDRLRRSTTVTSIRQQSDGVRVQAFDAAAERALAFQADHVVFAAPQFVAPHVIDRWRESGRDASRFRYGGWVVANLFLNGRPAEAGATMCWDNVIRDSKSLGYVTATHQTGLDHGPTVLTWYYPLTDGDPRVSRADLMRLSWQDWATVIVADLQRPHPRIASLIDRIDVMRWGHGMVQPRVGFVWSESRRRAAEPLGRIHFAGTDLSGIALMEEAFDHGVRAAEEVVSATS